MRIVTVTGAAVFLASYYGRWSRGASARRLRGGLRARGRRGLLRGRLNQHWFTDILGGIVVGWAFLAAVAATVRAFDPSPRTAAPALDADPDAAPRPTAPVGSDPVR